MGEFGEFTEVRRDGGNMCLNLRRHGFLWQLFTGVLFSLLLASPAWADPFGWDGGAASTNWADGANWNPDAGVGEPGVGDTLTFMADTNITLGADRQVDSLTINTANMIFIGLNSLTTGILSTIAPANITMTTGGGQLAVTGGFGRGVNAVTLNGPGAFSFQGTNSITGNGPLTLAAGARIFLNGDQTLHLPAGASGAGCEINLNNSALLTFYNAGAVQNFQGDITGTGSFRIQGGGDVTLSGSNSYSGSTNIAGAATFTATGAGNQLPFATDLTVTAPATLVVDDQNVGSISGTGTIQINANTLVTNQAGTSTFSGPINGAGTSLTMAGAGRLTLTGASTANLGQSNGTLVLNGSTTGGVNVTGGTFMGTGSADGMLNIAPGTFAPGNSIGTFNANGGLNMGAGGTLAIEVSGAASDQINVTGFAVPNNADLTITGGPTQGATLTIINNDGVDVVGGTFNGLIEGAIFTRNGYQYEITYVGGDGNDVVLTALTGVGAGGTTPEPEPEPNTLPAPNVSQGSGPIPIDSLDGPQLTWPHVKGASYYRIYRADCPVCKRKEIGRVRDNSFADATAIPGQPYYYWLRTENADGLGPYSNWMAAWRYEQNPGRAGDFNGDGIMDILWWNPDNNQLSIWFMNNGAVANVSQPGEGLNIAEWLLIATADLNGDGACDLLWWKPETGETKVWYLDKAKAMAGGDGEWLIKTSADLEAVTGHAAIAYPGDLNGDGRADILWRDYSNGDVTVWLMGSDGRPQLNGPPTPANDDITKGERPGLNGMLQWLVVDLADADANSRADVIWKDARNNRLATWVMDGSNITGVIPENRGLDLVWRSVGVGDVNGDSQADIIWRNEASGAVRAWLMQAGLFSEERTMVDGSEEATKWQVKATGDFCSPGCEDVYCKHSETSAVKILTLDGREFTPTVE